MLEKNADRVHLTTLFIVVLNLAITGALTITVHDYTWR